METVKLSRVGLVIRHGVKPAIREVKFLEGGLSLIRIQEMLTRFEDTVPSEYLANYAEIEYSQTIEVPEDEVGRPWVSLVEKYG